MRSILPLSVLLASLPILVLACSGSPEEAGDSCELDGDPCPDGTTCQAKGDDDPVCRIEAGGACNPKEDDDFCEKSLVCEPDEQNISRCSIPEGKPCDPAAADPHCSGQNVCAELKSGGHACYPPVLAHGRVFDAVTNAGIANAQVLGLNDQGSAITDIAVSAADGTYDLDLPVARNDDGSPVVITFSLRASAQDYQPFPSGLRTSLPIQTSGAVKQEKAYVLQLPLTDISLVPLPGAEKGLPSISGTVVAGEASAGVLVVAEAGGKGLTAVSSKTGAYTIFNVPPATYTVSGYAAGVALTPAPATVLSSPLTGIDLAQATATLGSVSGSVQIVNAPGGAQTSVVLVVESTFDDTFVRGEVPRGLRSPLSGAPNVSGAFSIANVPPGKYVVLAGFENDGLVRDPDPNISGTQIAHVEMPNPGQPIDVESSFKVTEALAVVSPGAEGPEGVSGTPTFVWQDDSSEDFYSVVVYDAYGNLTWENQMVPSQSGGDNVSVPYGGPALTTGMYYQFRATAWRSPGGNAGPISQTEDLRGVFFIK
ncbi:MAG: carboxypeptidase regulatory-like domain-containing protein [Polyangiaceae bacterium]|nr:carboxypeptidase regulatory-like domain-containing protein [Polyangiaceae bacterium]